MLDFIVVHRYPAGCSASSGLSKHISPLVYWCETSLWNMAVRREWARSSIPCRQRTEQPNPISGYKVICLADWPWLVPSWLVRNNANVLTCSDRQCGRWLRVGWDCSVSSWLIRFPVYSPGCWPWHGSFVTLGILQKLCVKQHVVNFNYKSGNAS